MRKTCTILWCTGWFGRLQKKVATFFGWVKHQKTCSICQAKSLFSSLTLAVNSHLPLLYMTISTMYEHASQTLNTIQSLHTLISRAGEIPPKIQNTLSKWSIYLIMAMQSNKSENKSWQGVSGWISIFLRGTSIV